MLRHIVFWKIKDNEDKEKNMERMVKMLYSLDGKIKGLESIELGYSFDQSSEYDVVLYAILKSPAALKFYQNHPEHVKCKKFISTIAEKRVSFDYLPEDPEFITLAPEDTNSEEQAVAEEKTIIEEKPAVEIKPIVDEKPIIEKKPTVEAKPIVDEKPIIEKKPTVEVKPTVKDKLAVEEKTVIETKSQIETKSTKKVNKTKEKTEPSVPDIQTSTAANYQSLVRPVIPGINAPIDFVPSEEPEENYNIIPEVVRKSIQQTQEDYDLLESIVDDNEDNLYDFSDSSIENEKTVETVEAIKAEEKAIPIIEPIKVEEPAKPVTESIKVEEPAKPVTESSQPISAIKKTTEQNSSMPFTGTVPSSFFKKPEPPKQPEIKKEPTEMPKTDFSKPLNSIPTGKATPPVKPAAEPLKRPVPPVPASPTAPTVPASAKPQKKSRFFGAKKVEDEAPKEIDMSNKWKCPSCGRINANYVGTCGCGASKPLEEFGFEPPVESEKKIPETKPEVKTETSSSSEWTCPKCGAIHSNFITDCSCGYVKGNLPPAAPMRASDFGAKPMKEIGTDMPRPVSMDISSVDTDTVKGLKLGERSSSTSDSKPIDNKPSWSRTPPSAPQTTKVSSASTPTSTSSKPAKRSIFGRKKNDKDVKEEIDMTKYWKCPSCGKLNYNYVGTCGCGESKPFEFDFGGDDTAETPVVPKSNAWKCPKCGRLNNNFVTNCLCGYINGTSD